MDSSMVKALVRSSRQARYAATAVALATLIACSAGNPIETTSDGPLANVPAYRSPQRAGQPIAGDVKNSVVYVSQEADNSISVFRLDGKRIRRITSRLNYPQGYSRMPRARSTWRIEVRTTFWSSGAAPPRRSKS